MSREVIAIDTEFIGWTHCSSWPGRTTGGQAKVIIQSGRVQVNGEPCLLGEKRCGRATWRPLPETGQEIEVSA